MFKSDPGVGVQKISVGVQSKKINEVNSRREAGERFPRLACRRVVLRELRPEKLLRAAPRPRAHLWLLERSP